MKLRALGWDLAVFMQMMDAQITRVGQAIDMLCQAASAGFEQRKVMLAALGKGDREDGLRFLVHNQLRFLSMSLLFSAVVPALLFLGRSTCCSVASIRTTSIKVSLGCNAFLPGSRNSPDFINASSTFWIVRHTVASLTP
jgi:hypothetical protein